MADEQKKFPFGFVRGEAMVRVVAAPNVKTFTSAAGKAYDLIDVRVVCSPYNGKQELEDQWMTLRFISSEAAKKLQKGDVVVVKGSLRINEWTGKDGEKRTNLEMTVSKDYDGLVVARRANPAGAAAGTTAPKAGTSAPKQASGAKEAENLLINDEDIPF